ncbi:DUF3089 domain-containing protein [Altererythrobacter fulvus]|uniref:DUF3089 domain-containing protein n=1 Tax=Caenibius fulvus TaxID=2126012 RepID=UPI00301ADB26
MKAARIFLYIVATGIVLVIGTFFALRIWSSELTAFAFVPTAEFQEQQPLAASAYADPQMWFARPGKGDDLVRWQPGGAMQKPGETRFAVFFVHPTSYLDKGSWNASLEDATANDRARLFLKGMASPFGQASEIWAPRYRQAAFGSFLTEDPKADKALDAAYRDVTLAFDYFLTQIPADEPIVLAGHSQGSLHLLRLLAEHIRGTPAQKRIAMVYAIGWPVSLEHDLPALGLPACSVLHQAGCIQGWVSFAEPADTGQMLERYNASAGFDGQSRKGSPILCSNPLTGRSADSAPASANLGTLVPNAAMTDGTLTPGAIPARCDASGILLIGDPPELGPAVLPGNNYHVYDIPLFWKNLQQDVTARVKQWTPPA